jgi:hypothetical protein
MKRGKTMRKSIFAETNGNTPKAIKPADATGRYQCSRTILMRLAEENGAIIRIDGIRSVWVDTNIMDKVFSGKGAAVNE